MEHFKSKALIIGLATIVQVRFPVVGTELATLAIALVTLNEIFGPVLFKWGLSRAGEIPSRQQGTPPSERPQQS